METKTMSRDVIKRITAGDNFYKDSKTSRCGTKYPESGAKLDGRKTHWKKAFDQRPHYGKDPAMERYGVVLLVKEHQR